MKKYSFCNKNPLFLLEHENETKGETTTDKFGVELFPKVKLKVNLS